MNTLVFDHAYVYGVAFDRSGNRNSGVPTAVTPGVAPFLPSLRFASPNSQVVVRPNASTNSLLSIRAAVEFYIDAAGPIPHRYNLMEGHLCFALFVQPNGALIGTIRDRTGNWIGAQSAAGVVAPQRWHVAEVLHDGINQIRVLLDGNEVARAANVPGPVGSVGAHGVAIGHWPETPGVYTFNGHIRSARLWKYDPRKDAQSLMSRCCSHPKELDSIVARLRHQGMTAEKLAALGQEAIGLATDATAKVRGTDVAKSAQHEQLGYAAWAALGRRDVVGYEKALAQLAAMAQDSLGKADMQSLHERQDRFLAQLPFSRDQITDLLKAFCLDGMNINPHRFAAAVQAAKGK